MKTHGGMRRVGEQPARAPQHTDPAAGQKHLAAERKEFERIVGAIQLVLANA